MCAISVWQEIWQGFDFSTVLGVLLSVIPSLLCITLHELSHGLTARALGDDTAEKAGRLTLRIRDDCRPFDPKERYKIYLEKGDFRNYGIKMIVEMTREMRYVNLMKLNILYIEV